MARKKNIPKATTWKTIAPMRRYRPALIVLIFVEFYTDHSLVVVAIGVKNLELTRKLTPAA